MDGARRDIFLQDRGDEENLLGVVLEHGKQRFGLATASPSSTPRRPVVVTSGGSLTNATSSAAPRGSIGPP
jgi:hypothetical protein